MSCRFDFDVPHPPDDLLAQIQRSLETAGGTFQPFPSGGAFTFPTPVGLFRGELRISGRSISVEVRDKPIFVPCSLIEAKLRERLGGIGFSF